MNVIFFSQPEQNQKRQRRNGGNTYQDSAYMIKAPGLGLQGPLFWKHLIFQLILGWLVNFLNIYYEEAYRLNRRLFTLQNGFLHVQTFFSEFD